MSELLLEGAQCSLQRALSVAGVCEQRRGLHGAESLASVTTEGPYDCE